MRRPVLLALALAILPATIAAANTSHEGWPQIDGLLVMHKADQNGDIQGAQNRHNELLGGHGDDTIRAGVAGDVIWGDYKPSGQPTTQVDHLYGGPGNDFIYASHGTNFIWTGGGVDVVHAHFGRGWIHCQSATVTVLLSRRGRPGWHLRGCRHISYKTLGY